MTEQDFLRIAEVIGPDDGKTRHALHAYFVGGLTKAEAARKADISRPTMTEYASRWERALMKLAQVNWKSISNNEVAKTTAKSDKKALQ